MSDDSRERTRHFRKLNSELRFNTYSDARLAGLFIDNDFPIVLFTKVFDVLRDQKFRAEEVTFLDAWDMLKYVSSRRRKDGVKRAEKAVAPTSPEVTTANHVSQFTASSGVVPPIILDLVVDLLMVEQIPLGVAAMEPWSSCAFKSNLEPFHNMSLVHRSWTNIAQRALRHRVVVPYQYMNKFLSSPFCGPSVKEMILYWSVDNADIGVTKGDIWLLDAVLEQTSNLRSLAFVSSITWPRKYHRPPFDVNLCLEIIADMLPNLESLWLKHVPLPFDDRSQQSAATCDEIRSLCQQLPKMRTLKFLSLRSWGFDGQGLEPNFDDNPSAELATMELDFSGLRHLPEKDLAWLVKPRSGFRLHSLSVASRLRSLNNTQHAMLREYLKDCIAELKEIRLCIIGLVPQLVPRIEPFYTDVLRNAGKLSRADVFLIDTQNLELALSDLFLPPCLEHLAIHTNDDEGPMLQRRQWDIIADGVLEQLPSLSRLQSILLTSSTGLSPVPDAVVDSRWDFDYLVPSDKQIMNPLDGEIPEILINACRDRNIKLTRISNAFPFHWEIPFMH